MLSTDGPHRNVMKFKPPMCFTKENVNLLCEKLEAVFTEIEDDGEEIIGQTAEKAKGGANTPELAKVSTIGANGHAGTSSAKRRTQSSSDVPAKRIKNVPCES